MNYLLVRGEVIFVFFLFLAAIAEIVGIHFFQNSLENVLYVIMAAVTAALIPMSLCVIRLDSN